MSKIGIGYILSFLLILIGTLASVIEFEDVTRARLKEEIYWNSYTEEIQEFSETTELYIYTNNDDLTSVLYNDIDTLTFYSGVFIKEFSMFFFTEDGYFYPEFTYLYSENNESYNDYHIVGKITFQKGIYSYNLVHNQLQQEEHVVLTTSEPITYHTTNLGDYKMVYYIMAGAGFLIMSGTFIISSNRADEEKLSQGYTKRERY